MMVKSDREDSFIKNIIYLQFTCIKYVNPFLNLTVFLPETEGDLTGEHLLCQRLAELLHFLIQKAVLIILSKDMSC